MKRKLHIPALTWWLLVALAVILLAARPGHAESLWTCQFVLRPPNIAAEQVARIYYGCQHRETLWRHGWYLDMTPEYRGAFNRAVYAFQRNRPIQPTMLGLPIKRVTARCDQFWLWAQDEGERAPSMTRVRKISQVCSVP